ncbi:hypothetical protein THRCLA_02447 [Thraustotheca clavata]|uniref:Uncharacterized protein n=1 Tax=Thraustotheca clavata TaxID=74557 RepID=A0A1W0A562_9STRA|nr:hypothetical protein THRCLA_02447 [Thraustotheca clavata]
MEAKGFHDYVGDFYMALAEDKLDSLVDALQGLRESAKEAAMTPEAELLQEMLRDCEQKAKSKELIAVNSFKEFVVPKTAALNKRRAQTSQDLADLLQELEDTLLSVLNSYYTAQVLDSSSISLKYFSDYMLADAKQRAELRLDQLKKLKAGAKLNSDGYIDRGIHLEALTGMFQDSTHLLQYIEQSVWPEQVTGVFSPMNQEILDKVIQVLGMYSNDARLVAWERKISISKSDANHVEADESLQMIDLLLDELTLILQWGFQYLGSVADLATYPPLQNKIHELNGVYLLMEQFYVSQSVRKAVVISDHEEVEPNVFEISTVQDVSFVLDKAFTRATQSMNYHIILSVVTAIVESLDTTFMPSILNIPNRTFNIPLPVSSPRHQETKPSKEETKEKSFGDALLEVVDLDLTEQLQHQAKMMMAINSAHKSTAYVDTLHARLSELSMQFPNYPPFLECLPKALNELQTEVSQVITIGTKELYEIALRKKLKTLFEQSSLSWQFELALDSYEFFDVHNSPLLTLVHTVLQEKSLRRFRRGLNQPNFEKLWRHIVVDMCQWIEQGIETKKFNEWGAMQLDRDIRQVMTLLAKYPIEPISLLIEFTRLDQIVMIVNMVQASDILEYDKLRSALSISEIEAKLALRFRKSSIGNVVDQLQNQHL